LVGMAVRVGRIEVPVGSGEIASGAVDRLAAPREPVERVGHFLQRPGLPGDLVHRAARRARGRTERLERALRKEHERVMVGAVAREIADRRPGPALLVLGHALAEVDRIGDAEAEQPAIEVLAALGIGDVDAEVPEAADAERPGHAHAADDVLFRLRGGNPFGLVHRELLAPRQRQDAPDFTPTFAAPAAAKKSPARGRAFYDAGDPGYAISSDICCCTRHALNTRSSSISTAVMAKIVYAIAEGGRYTPVPPAWAVCSRRTAYIPV